MDAFSESTTGWRPSTWKLAGFSVDSASLAEPRDSGQLLLRLRALAVDADRARDIRHLDVRQGARHRGVGHGHQRLLGPELLDLRGLARHDLRRRLNTGFFRLRDGRLRNVDALDPGRGLGLRRLLRRRSRDLAGRRGFRLRKALRDFPGLGRFRRRRLRDQHRADEADEERRGDEQTRRGRLRPRERDAPNRLRRAVPVDRPPQGRDRPLFDAPRHRGGRAGQGQDRQQAAAVLAIRAVLEIARGFRRVEPAVRVGRRLFRSGAVHRLSVRHRRAGPSYSSHGISDVRRSDSFARIRSGETELTGIRSTSATDL